MAKTSTYITLKRKLKNIITRLFGTRKYQKLVILGRQRTGSSLLLKLLHEHPGVDMAPEVFRQLKGRSCRTVWNETFGKKLPWIKYAGFKLFYNHPDDSDDREVWDILNTNTDVKIIHIKRDNILRTYISKLVALKTGAWNSVQEQNSTEILDKRVEVDINHCIKELREIKRRESEFGKDMFPNHHYIELSFEELTINTTHQMSQILSFLNLQQQNVEKSSVNLRRQNPEGLIDLVSNYTEFYKDISNTEFKELLP